MTVRTSPGDCTAVDQDGGTNAFLQLALVVRPYGAGTPL